VTGTNTPPSPARQTGADLARVALRAARQDAKKRGNTPARRPARHSDDRDPITPMAAVQSLLDSRGWAAPVTGGSILDQWPTIAPELADKARAVSYRPKTGVLVLAACSPAAATHLRLLEQQLTARINKHLRTTGRPRPAESQLPGQVQALQIIQDTTAPARVLTPPPTVPPSPANSVGVRTRENASTGYRRALAAHQASKADEDDRLAPAVRAAIERQDQVLRQRREPEVAFADARELTEQLQARARTATDPHVQALARARAENTRHLPRSRRHRPKPGEPRTHASEFPRGLPSTT